MDEQSDLCIADDDTHTVRKSHTELSLSKRNQKVGFACIFTKFVGEDNFFFHFVARIQDLC